MANRIPWNERLAAAGVILTINEGHTQKYMALSTGVILNTKNMVERFWRRLAVGWDIDVVYGTNEDVKQKYITQIKSENARKGGIACQEKNPHIRIIAKENLKAARLSGKNLEKMRSGEISIWNKGLTKETDSRVMDISKRQQGVLNTVHRQTIETRARMSKNNSEKMKTKILNGTFTPNIRNSRTHWQVEYNGKKFRSSWEAAWSALNPEFEYETKRITYTLDGKEKIYIVDFFDPVTNTIVEIKPKEHLKDNKMLAKIEAAIKWAEDYNGSYQIVTQDFLIENMTKIMYSDLPEDVKQKIKGIK